jgi:hypothetical protein
VKGKASKKPVKGEKGQALMIVLVMMLFGSLIIAPVLSYMGSGLRVGQDVYEERMYLLYSADSGVENAIWQVNNKQLNSDLFGYDDPDYDQYAYSDCLHDPPYEWDYDLPLDAEGNEVNNKDVKITLENVWIPKDIAAPSPDKARLIVEGTADNPPKLMIVGGLSGTSATQYQIGIIYYYGIEGPSALQVQKVGIWLPTGFHYAGNCSLANDTDTAPYAAPDVDEHYKSGEAVVWDFGSLALNTFPGSGSTGSPMVKSFTFQFSGPPQQFPAAAISWINTNGVSGIDYAWDADVQVYKILSTAGVAEEKETTVEAYAAKIEVRKLGAEVSGDYVATGNTLMLPDLTSSGLRSRLLKESSATIASGSGENQIPANATMEAAYLYWSGFIDHYYWYWHTKQGQEDPYGTGWYFSSDTDNLTGQVYDASNLPQIIANTKINTVSFGANGVMQDVTANHWQVCLKTNDSPNCWYYCCLYDATDLIQGLIDSKVLGASGSGTYTLGHVDGVVNQTPPRDITVDFPRTPNDPSSIHDNQYSFKLYDSSGNPTSEYTGYPLGTPATKLPGSGSYEPNKQIPNTGNTQNRYNASYAGWSLVIIYSSPDTQGHQLYLYDIKNPNFTFVEGFGDNPNPDFDGDGQPGGKISGFLVPPQIAGETNAAKLTCFVGEGDEGNTGDYIEVKGPNSSWRKLWDGISTTSNTKANPTNIWNSRSRVLGTVSGVDIDTPGVDPTANPPQYITWSSNVLRSGDTLAEINLPSPGDGFTLIYVILSFRSEVTSGGTLSYLVR